MSKLLVKATFSILIKRNLFSDMNFARIPDFMYLTLNKITKIFVKNILYKLTIASSMLPVLYFANVSFLAAF